MTFFSTHYFNRLTKITSIYIKVTYEHKHCGAIPALTLYSITGMQKSREIAHTAAVMTNELTRLRSFCSFVEKDRQTAMYRSTLIT